MDSMDPDEDIIGENPWSDEVLPVAEVLPDTDTMDITQNVWGAPSNNGSTTVIDEVPKQPTEDIAAAVEQIDEPAIEVEVTQVPQVTLEQEIADLASEDDDNDDFGSFEEQPIELPIFAKPIDQILNTIFPSVEKLTVSDGQLAFPQETYNTITSSKRVYNAEKVRNDYNRIHYWSSKSAINAHSKEIIDHWDELEQGFTSKERSKNINNTSYALFNWSSKTDDDSKTTTQIKRLENKSHQNQLLKIVLEEVNNLVEKERRRELDLQTQRQNAMMRRAARRPNPLLSPNRASQSPQQAPQDKSPSKKKFSIGSLFKFSKKSSISKDHISSSNLKLPASPDADSFPSTTTSNNNKTVSQSNNPISLASEFEKSMKKTDISDHEDDHDNDDNDNDNAEVTYAYNNLMDLNGADQEANSSSSSSNEEEEEEEEDDDAEFEDFVASPAPEESRVLSPPAASIFPNELIKTHIASPLPLSVTPIGKDDNDDDDDEFEEFVRSPSPVSVPVTAPVPTTPRQDMGDLLIDL